MIDFDTATRTRDALSADLSLASATLSALTNELSGNKPRPMGLTPDSVKADPDWQNAKARVDWLFRALQEFNKDYVRTFKAELVVQRIQERKALAA